MSLPSDDWREWLIAAHQVIDDWELNSHIRILNVSEASGLAERIARALDDAFKRGRRSDHHAPET